MFIIGLVFLLIAWYNNYYFKQLDGKLTAVLGGIDRSCQCPPAYLSRYTLSMVIRLTKAIGYGLIFLLTYC